MTTGHMSSVLTGRRVWGGGGVLVSGQSGSEFFVVVVRWVRINDPKVGAEGGGSFSAAPPPSQVLLPGTTIIRTVLCPGLLSARAWVVGTPPQTGLLTLRGRTAPRIS